jgi:hypothetical protein
MPLMSIPPAIPKKPNLRLIREELRRLYRATNERRGLGRGDAALIRGATQALCWVMGIADENHNPSRLYSSVSQR